MMSEQSGWLCTLYGYKKAALLTLPFALLLQDILLNLPDPLLAMLRTRFFALLAAALVASTACVVMARPAPLEVSMSARTQGDPVIVGHGGSKAVGGRLGHEDVIARTQGDPVIVGHGNDKKPPTVYAVRAQGEPIIVGHPKVEPSHNAARTQGDPIIVGHRPGSAIVDGRGVATPRTQVDPVIVGHGSATKETHPTLSAMESIPDELFEELDKDDVKLQAWLDARDAERLNATTTTLTRSALQNGKHGIAVIIKRPWPLYPGCHPSWPDWGSEAYIIPPRYLWHRW